MSLHLVGLGLHDAKDITVKGLERVKAADEVYAEFYTAILAGTSHVALEAFLGRPVKLLDRLGVEVGGDDLVKRAKSREVVLLTAGDPLTATTHTDLMVRAGEAGVECRIVHAPSIYSAAPGLLGLQHYKFGRTTTLVRPERNWAPTSPFDALVENHARDLHTLVLLDIKADEEYFMTANQGLALLLDLAAKTGNPWFNGRTQVGVVARAGADVPVRRTGAVADLLEQDFGPPLHCIVVPGQLHDVEEAAWRLFRQGS
ncbi:MAG: diphthine synthase [bacterium]